LGAEGLMKGGQNRPLDSLHLVFFDALRVKIGEEAWYGKRAYFALGDRL